MKERKLSKRVRILQTLKHVCGVTNVCEIHMARKKLHRIDGYMPAGPFKLKRLAKEKAYRERQKGVA